MGMTLCTFLSYGAFFAWFVSGPVLLIKELRVSPVAFGWSVMILASILMLAGRFFFDLTVTVVVFPVILFYFGSTFIWPNAFATAFTSFGYIAGYAGALYGFMQISGGASLGGLMSYLPDSTQLPLALVMLGASLCSWAIYECVVKKKLYG